MSRLRYRFSRAGMQWLGLPSASVSIALSVSCAFALLFVSVACGDAATITLYPAELVDPAPDEPFATDPLTAPAPLACDDCRERRVELAGGDSVLVRVPAAPALELDASDVAFVELAESVSEEASEAKSQAPQAAQQTAPKAALTRHAVHLVLTPSGRAKWTAFAQAEPSRFVLVELAGRAVDLFRPLGWTRGLRIGVFDETERRDRFVAGLPFERRASDGAEAADGPGSGP